MGSDSNGGRNRLGRLVYLRSPLAIGNRHLQWPFKQEEDWHFLEVIIQDYAAGGGQLIIRIQRNEAVAHRDEFLQLVSQPCHDRRPFLAEVVLNLRMAQSYLTD